MSCIELLAPQPQDPMKERGWKLAVQGQASALKDALSGRLKEKIKPLTASIFLLDEAASLAILRELMMKHELKHQGRRLHSDLFTPSHLVHELTWKEDSQNPDTYLFFIRAKLEVGKTAFYLDEAQVCGLGRWVIYQHFLYPLPGDLDRRAALAQAHKVDEKQARQWLKDPQSYDGLSELTIDLKQPLPNLPSHHPQAHPCLELLDRTLSRALFSYFQGDLQTTYQGQKDPIFEGFAGDLQELGASWSPQKGQWLFDSPQRAQEAIYLLMEMGWIILGPGGKSVKKLGKFHIDPIQTLPDGFQATGYIELEQTPSQPSQQGALLTSKLGLGPLAHHLKKGAGMIELQPGHYLLLPRSLPSALQGLAGAKPLGDKVSWQPWQAAWALETQSESPNLELGKWHKLQNLSKKLAQDPMGTISNQIQTTFDPLSLRDYQILGVQWLLQLRSMGLGGLLADEMGLGKTLQILAFLASCPQEKSTLIIVPRSLLSQWSEQIEQLLGPERIRLYHGSERERYLNDSNPNYWISTYQTLAGDIEKLALRRWQTVIFDESHLIRNPKSQGYLAAKRLVASMKIAVSGTPIFNTAEDLWTQMRLVAPTLFTDESIGDEPTLGFKAFSPLWLRRTKQDVASELPEKIEQAIYLDMEKSQQELYEKVLQTQVKDLGNEEPLPLQILEKILRLRQCCLLPMLIDPNYPSLGVKYEQLVQDLEIFLSAGRSVLVFSQFSSVLEAMFSAFYASHPNSYYIDAKTPKRESVLEDFKQKGAGVLFMTLGVGSVGLNLTAASAVILLDPWWNESVENQAIDRVHRLGQQRGVNVFRYLVKSSLEEAMMEIKKSKRSVVEAWKEPTLSSGFEEDETAQGLKLWHHLREL